MVDMPPLPENPLAPVLPDAGRPQLPKRARQANLAPGLRRRDRDARFPLPEEQTEPTARSPEEARSLLTAIQQGWAGIRPDSAPPLPPLPSRNLPASQPPEPPPVGRAEPPDSTDWPAVAGWPAVAAGGTGSGGPTDPTHPADLTDPTDPTGPIPRITPTGPGTPADRTDAGE